MFKRLVQHQLERAVRAYFRRHSEVVLVVVVGSVGKTMTKTYVATLLAKQFRVRMSPKNHNSELSAPLAMLGIEFPQSLKNPFVWLKIMALARWRVRQASDVDVIVQELGTDRIGQIPHFATYLKPHISVVTAVSPEHMEYFGTIDEVAREELSIVAVSRLALINRDDIDPRYAELITNPAIDTYGSTDAAEYRIEVADKSFEGISGQLYAPEIQTPMMVESTVIGIGGIRAVTAAAAVGCKLGMLPTDIATGITHMPAVPGRMQLLRGANGSSIIDDSYNASPLSVTAALQTLYEVPSPQRIALLGSMNELGESAAAEHEAIGKLCDPNMLAWVVTVGQAAAEHLAPAAKARGCQVRVCQSALEAGSFVHSLVEPGGVVLVKGSEGGVYLEEAIKLFLHSTDDEARLVRQSLQWLTKKQNYFET